MKTIKKSTNDSADNKKFSQGLQDRLPSQKILIAYFSHSGNTRVVSEHLRNLTGGELFEIKPVDSYPSTYQAVVDQAKQEINTNYKPSLQSDIKNITAFDLFFIGSPNWWSTIAPPVATFLSAHDFTGKTIIPFITHEGSRMGHSVTDIKKLCPTASVEYDRSFRGRRVRDARDEVSEWLREINVANFEG